MTLRITLHIFHTTFALLSMQYLMQWQLTNPCLLPDVIIEADRRDGELEGT
jgi:tetrahydromethanopterin S-methyltransferase subunit E